MDRRHRHRPGLDALEPRRLFADGFALDPSYGIGGRATVGAVGEAPDYVTRLMSTPDGKLLVLGRSGDTYPVTHLTRFNLDGSLDAAYGDAGRRRVTAFPSAGVVDAVIGGDGSVVLQREGTGLALARHLSNGAVDPSFNVAATAAGRASDLALTAAGGYVALTGQTITKLTASGAADPTFGVNGQVTIPDANGVRFTPLVAQPLADGSTLVGGTDGNVSQGVRRAAFRHFYANGTANPAFSTLRVPAPLSNDSRPIRLLLQPDGKVVAVVSDLAANAQGYAMRINAPANVTGSFDAGFGSTALFTPNLSTSRPEAIGDLELDANGRLVGSAFSYAATGIDGETALFRLNPNGTPDLGFGSGGYRRNVYVSSQAAYEWGPRDLVVSGANARLYTATSIHALGSATHDQYLERFALDGTVDATFGTAGKVRTSYDTPQQERLSDAIALPDGSTVFVGSLPFDARAGVVAKLAPDGTPASFGSGGATTVYFGGTSSDLYAIAAAPGGKLVAVGSRRTVSTTAEENVFAVARLNADGTPDASFGNNGTVISTFPGGNFQSFTKVLVDVDGTIYAAGHFNRYGAGGYNTGAIVRYAPNGQLDTSFGTGGILTLRTLFGDGVRLTLGHLQLVGGKLLIAGRVEYDGGGDPDSFLARLSLAGVPDAAFGTGGTVRYRSGDGYPGVLKVVGDAAGGRYYTLDVARDQNYRAHAYVRRHTFNGQPDLGWASNGIADVLLADADAIADLDLRPDGRLVLTGTRTVSSSGTATNNTDFLFVGLTAAGALELDFGVDGFQAIEQLKHDRGAALLPAAGGRFVVAGTAYATVDASDFVALRLSVGADAAPPTIASTAAEFETRRAVVVTFSEDVLASLTKSDLTLQRRASFSDLLVSAADWTFEAANVGGRTRVTLALAGSLPDAEYGVIVAPASVADAAGNASSTLYSTRVHFLAGDANRDRVVNFADLVVLAQNYGALGRGFSGGNFDYSPDGRVDFADLVLLAQRYGTSLAATAGVSGRPVEERGRRGDTATGLVDAAGPGGRRVG